MDAVTAQTMRNLDAATIQSGVFSGMELMEHAGAAAAEEISTAFPHAHKIVILAGKGNNGGDGSVIASILAAAPGRTIFFVFPFEEKDLKGDALTAFRRIPDSVVIRHSLPSSLPDYDLIVDAMLGTGFAGSVRDPFAAWIRTVNASGVPVVSVDIPSGLNADDGTVSGEAVRADLTVSFALPKAGMFLSRGPEFCGRIHVRKIGIPESLTGAASSVFRVCSEDDAKMFLFREPYDTYKNKRGHILVIGGCREYSGAPFLTGTAALRAGGGLVSAAVPDGTVPSGYVPHALMVRRFPQDHGFFRFSPEALEEIHPLMEKASVFAIGPGLGNDPSVDGVLSLALKQEKPLVLDADALNRISAVPALMQSIRDRKPGLTVMTPHKGELARLMSAAGLKEDSDSVRNAIRMAEYTGAILVSKGPHSIVAAPDGSYARNLSGYTALATAGSGDVLTGIVAAFSARTDESKSLFQAVCAAVYLHGFCGECSAPVPASGRGVTADDLADIIPSAMRRISPFA